MGILKEITVFWDSGMTLHIPVEFYLCFGGICYYMFIADEMMETPCSSEML
jgi:hypothetical protein